MMTLDSPRGWVHPDAARMPAVEIFRPWPVAPVPENMPTHWEVVTEASRYVLDLDECTATRYNLDVRDLEPGAVHAQLRRDAERLRLLAVIDCRVGSPMLLMLTVEPDGLIGTIRVTTNVRTCAATSP